MAATVAQRRRSAHAAALAAKQRRQKIMLGVLLVIVIGALAYEAPGIIKRIQGSSSPTSVGPPLQTTQPKAHTLPKAFRGAVSDPFAVRALADGDSGVAPSFGRDPFAPPPAPSAASTGPAPSVTSPL